MRGLTDRRTNRGIGLPWTHDPVRELRVPAADGSVDNGDVHQREGSRGVEIAHATLANELRGDLVPVPRWRGCPGTVGPVLRDLQLRRGQRLGDLTYFRQRLTELRRVERGRWRRAQLAARFPEPGAHRPPHGKLR